MSWMILSLGLWWTCSQAVVLAASSEDSTGAGFWDWRPHVAGGGGGLVTIDFSLCTTVWWRWWFSCWWWEASLPPQAGPLYHGLPLTEWQREWLRRKPVSFIYFKKFYLFWLYHMACAILVLQLGIQLTFPAVEMQNLNHRTAREIPSQCLS